MNKHTNLPDIHNAILDAVREHWSEQQNQLCTVDAYDPVKGCAVDSPAVLLSVDQMNILPHEQSTKTAIALDLALHCVLSNRTQGHGVQIEIRQFAAEVCRLVQSRGSGRWGLGRAVGEPDNIAANPSEFSPDKKGFESWVITWTQNIFIGHDEAPAKIPDTLYASNLPETGDTYKDQYQQLNNYNDARI